MSGLTMREKLIDSAIRSSGVPRHRMLCAVKDPQTFALTLDYLYLKTLAEAKIRAVYRPREQLVHGIVLA